MKYAGVIVLYNPTNEVIENIKSYINEIDVLYAVDNSTHSNEEIVQFNEKIVYLPNYKNLGIAEALNIGAERAIDYGCEWLLTMDQDSSFNMHGVATMKDYIENSQNGKLGIVSPFHNTVRADGMRPEGVDHPIIVMTSGNLINLSIYKAIHGFKNWMFIDCVDFDFCLNLIRNGYEIDQLNKVVMDHELGDTKKIKMFNKKIFVDNHNHIRRYYIVRNRHYIYDEYVTDFRMYCDAEIRCTRKEVIKIILFEKHKLKKIYYMYKGYRDYKKGKKGGIRKC